MTNTCHANLLRKVKVRDLRHDVPQLQAGLFLQYPQYSCHAGCWAGFADVIVPLDRCDTRARSGSGNGAELGDRTK